MVLFALRAVELFCICFFLAPLAKRKSGIWSTVLQVLVFAALSVLVRQVIYLFDWESEFIYINFAYYPLIYAFMMLRYDISIKEGIYYLLLFFLCIHALRLLVVRISIMIYGTSYLMESGALLYNLLFLVLFAVILCFEFALLKKPVFRFPKHRLTWPQLGLIIIATIPIIYITNLFLILNVDLASLPISTMMIGLVCSVCGIVIVIGYNNTLALAKNKQEIATLEALLTSQQKQYQLKKETTELINTKYHDLKKHFNYLASIDSPKEREEYLEQLKLQISIYDAFHDTGNDTLDIVLSDKDMECRKYGIALLLFIDGKQLDFLKKLDIVTIFGNAIDNSIEAVRNLPEEHRSITVRMHEYDTWLVVSFENNFDGELKMEGKQAHFHQG